MKTKILIFLWTTMMTMTMTMIYFMRTRVNTYKLMKETVIVRLTITVTVTVTLKDFNLRNKLTYFLISMKIICFLHLYYKELYLIYLQLEMLILNSEYFLHPLWGC